MAGMGFVGVGAVDLKSGVSRNVCRRHVAMRAEGAEVTRSDMLRLLALAPLGFAVGVHAEDLDGFSKSASGLQYKQLEKGTGKAAAKIGDLVAVRFTASYKGRVFDDVYKTEQPLFIRVGNGTLLKGMEEIIQGMVRGDRYQLVIPPELAFGSAGRRATAGKPTIPPNATIDVDLTLTDVPGTELELIEMQELDE